MTVDLFTDWSNDPAGMPEFWLEPTNSDRVKIVARTIDIEKWEDAIRKAGAPETK